MTRQIFAGAVALILATAMTSGAIASDHRGAGGHHWRHGHRAVGVYATPDAWASSGGHYTSLGPLGFTLGPPPGRGCGPGCVPGSSISAWTY
jgi:hypothetical protein